MAASLSPGGIGLDASSWPTDSKMADIRTTGKLIVGVSGDALEWGYSDPRSGDITGYDVDVAQAVAKALGVSVEYRVLPLSARLSSFSGKTPVDLVAERFSMTCERWQGTGSAKGTPINFSSEYYRAGQKILVRKDLANTISKPQDLKGYPVCAVDGSTSLANFKALNTGATIRVASDSGQCLVQFQEGTVAGITADDTTLAGYSAQDKNAVVVGQSFGPVQYYGLGIASGDAGDVFTRYVNVVLQQMRDSGKLQQLYDKWMAEHVTSGSTYKVPDALYGRDVDALKRS